MFPETPKGRSSGKRSSTFPTSMREPRQRRRLPPARQLDDGLVKTALGEAHHAGHLHLVPFVLAERRRHRGEPLADEQIDQRVDFGRRNCRLPLVVPDRRAGSEDRGARELAIDAALGFDPRAIQGVFAGGEIAQGSIDGRTGCRVLQSCERDEKKGDPVWH